MPIYQEKQTTYPIFYLLLFLELPLIIYAIFFGFQQKEYSFSCLLLGIMAILVFSLINFFFLKLKVNDKKLVVSFGLFFKNLDLKEIKSVVVQNYNFWNYWGFGIRWNPLDNSRAWVARAGKGLVVKTKNREYFFSTKTPEKLKNLLLTKINQL